eukprot:jgi/Picsp_1/740/NSC_04229-R1_hypothetical protein CHLNCDRAFT_139528 [Chlorella variabilis]
MMKRKGRLSTRCIMLWGISIALGALGVAYFHQRSLVGHIRSLCKKLPEDQVEISSRNTEKKNKEKMMEEKDALRKENDQMKKKLAELERQKTEVEESLEVCEEQSLKLKQKDCSEEISKEKMGYMRSVMEADILLLRAMLEKYKKAMDREWQKMVSQQEEKGILVVAGDPKYILNAFVSLWPVRKYWKSNLPITVVYWGETEKVSRETQEFFVHHLQNVSFIDLADGSALQWPAHQRSLFLKGQSSGRLGWVLKLAAAYFVPYQEILYLDADSTPLSNPMDMFSLPEYKKSGSLFWPDTPCQRPRLFDQLIEIGLIEEEEAPRRDEHESESGQWLLNRKSHREAIEFTLSMGSHSDFTFSHAFGDKDLFRAGFALAGKAKNYSLVSVPLGFAWSSPKQDEKEERIMRGYIQFSPDGQPMFHHRAGWLTKYDFTSTESLDLDAISCPLSCGWLRAYWPMPYPGTMDNTRLTTVDKENCSYSIDSSFKEATDKCNSGFTGDPNEKIPLFPIANSVIESIHDSLESAWKTALKGREESNAQLFQVNV